MRVAAVQHDIVWEDAAATRDRVRPLVERTAAGGAELVVLTEMFATGFSMRPERIAEDEGGASEQWLRSVAAELGVTLVASLAQRGGDGAYRNNALLVRPDGATTRYAKIHPFSYAGEHEKYAAGAEFATVDVDGVRVSLFVCYDLRFADEFWALAHETDLYVVVANWPAARQEHWRALLRARAIENQTYVLGVNRVGTVVGARRDAEYAGGSALLDPLGQPLFEAGSQEVVLAADVNPQTVRTIREAFPFLQDRR